MLFSKRIHTSIEIESKSSTVWEVLADLPSYPRWNPMIIEADGVLSVGSRLTLRFQPGGRRGRTFKPSLTVVEPDRELRWRGKPGVRGLFESEHCFLLEPGGAGKTSLVHDMIFWGLLVPLAGRALESRTRKPFEEMNEALKSRAESADSR